MEYYDGKLCISARELVDKGIMTRANYDKKAWRGQIDVVRQGKGLGNYALISIDSLPSKYKEKVREFYPDGAQTHLRLWVMENYETDQEAVAFFRDEEKTGVDLQQYPEKIREYVTNASVLNCCIKLYERAATARKLMGEKYNWDWMADAIEALRTELGHTLPTSTLRFRKKVNEYKCEGYGCLISGKFGNQNKRLVTKAVEEAVLSLSCLENKPYNTTVWEQWKMFLCGELDIFHLDTGELLDPDDFTDKNGEPLVLSESTINNILNQPMNKLRINQRLLMPVTLMHEQLPHMHRHNGRYSLSQITMDDVDLSRKLKDTKKWVHAYYAYDDVSECVIGASYARDKDTPLVVDCFRDMFRILAANGWGTPKGIEVENHLMSQWRDTYLSPGVVFEFVRFCAPQNSQEKRAEHYNGAKKTSIIHKNHAGIGRPFGKGKRRVEQKKVSDASNELYEEKKYYSWDELVADDRQDNWEWNHSLHSDQKRWPGKTRWEVLVENVNPDLWPLDRRMLARWIGVSVETSVRRNSTVRVNYADWWLSSPEVLERLAPNNYKVTACYLPDEEGQPKDVYLYQNERYIDTVEKVETYNRVMAEQTDEDREKFEKQQKRVAHFNKYLKEHAITKVGVMKTTATPPQAEPSEEEALELPQVQEQEEELNYIPNTDYSKMGLEAY